MTVGAVSRRRGPQALRVRWRPSLDLSVSADSSWSNAALINARAEVRDLAASLRKSALRLDLYRSLLKRRMEFTNDAALLAASSTISSPEVSRISHTAAPQAGLHTVRGTAPIISVLASRRRSLCLLVIPPVKPFVGGTVITPALARHAGGSVFSSHSGRGADEPVSKRYSSLYNGSNVSTHYIPTAVYHNAWRFMALSRRVGGIVPPEATLLQRIAGAVGCPVTTAATASGLAELTCIAPAVADEDEFLVAVVGHGSARREGSSITQGARSVSEVGKVSGLELSHVMDGSATSDGAMKVRVSDGEQLTRRTSVLRVYRPTRNAGWRAALSSSNFLSGALSRRGSDAARSGVRGGTIGAAHDGCSHPAVRGASLDNEPAVQEVGVAGMSSDGGGWPTAPQTLPPFPFEPDPPSSTTALPLLRAPPSTAVPVVGPPVAVAAPTAAGGEGRPFDDYVHHLQGVARTPAGTYVPVNLPLPVELSRMPWDDDAPAGRASPFESGGGAAPRVKGGMVMGSSSSTLSSRSLSSCGASGSLPLLRCGGVWPRPLAPRPGSSPRDMASLLHRSSPHTASRGFGRGRSTSTVGGEVSWGGAVDFAARVREGGVVAVGICGGVDGDTLSRIVHVSAYFGVPYVILDPSFPPLSEEVAADSGFGVDAVSLVRPRQTTLGGVVASFVRRGGVALPLLHDPSILSEEAQRRMDRTVEQQQGHIHNRQEGNSEGTHGAAVHAGGWGVSGSRGGGNVLEDTFLPAAPTMLIVGSENGGVPADVLAACTHTAVVDFRPATTAVEAVLKEWPAQYFRTVLTAAALTHGSALDVGSSVCPTRSAEHLLASLLVQLEAPVRSCCVNLL